MVLALTRPQNLVKYMVLVLSQARKPCKIHGFPDPQQAAARPGRQSVLKVPEPSQVQVCSKNSSFLVENSIFCAQTGPGAQPGVQVCSKNSSFLVENSLFCVQTGPGSPATNSSLQYSQQPIFQSPVQPTANLPVSSTANLPTCQYP